MSIKFPSNPGQSDVHKASETLSFIFDRGGWRGVRSKTIDLVNTVVEYLKNPISDAVGALLGSNGLLLQPTNGGLWNCDIANGVSTNSVVITDKQGGGGVTVSGNGKVAAVWNQGMLVVYDRNSSNVLTERYSFYPVDVATVYAMQLNHDGSKLFVRSTNFGVGAVAFFDLTASSYVQHTLTETIPDDQNTTVCELTADESYLIVSSHHNLYVYSIGATALTYISSINVSSGTGLLGGIITGAAFNPDSTLLAVAVDGEQNALFNFSNGTLTLNSRFGDAGYSSGKADAIDWSPNGKYIACAQGEASAHLFSYRDGVIVDEVEASALISGHKDAVSYAFSHDSKYLAIGVQLPTFVMVIALYKVDNGAVLEFSSNVTHPASVSFAYTPYAMVFMPEISD